MTYKIVFLALILTILPILSAGLGGNLLSLLPIDLSLVTDYIESAAAGVSSFIRFGDLVFIPGFLLDVVHLFGLALFWVGNIYIIYRIIHLFR